MSEQKPGVGRIVIYKAAGPHEVFNGSDRHAAVITAVFSDRMVNLKVLPDLSPVFDASSVERCDAPEEPGLRRWYWPPRV